MTWRGRLQRLWWVVPAFAIAFPMARLLPLDAQFAQDWFNHKWLAAFTGEYLREHHGIPVVINTPAQAGMPYPVFYGTLFYPLLSLFTTWMIPGIVVRLCVVFVTWLQYRVVTGALVKLAVPLWTARAISCLVTWAIYPSTNLYSRGAITEYVAVALLTTLVAAWFLLILAEPRDRLRIGLGIGLLFVLTAGTHPTTALYSLPILALLLVATYVEHGRDLAFWRGLAKALALPCALVLVVLAPWLYALAKYQSVLRVATDGGPWYYDGIDTWTTRFYPIPHDPRVEGVPITSVSSPYLDAQVNVALLLLVLGGVAILMWRNRKLGLASLRAIAVALIVFAFFAWISIDRTSFDHLPDFMRMLQLAYRAITYNNIALLLAVFTIASLLRRGGHRFEPTRPAIALLVGCLLLSAVGVVIRWQHTSAITTRHGSAGIRTTPAERRHWAQLPPEFYGYNAYATPRLYTAKVTPGSWTEAKIPIGDTGDQFGEPLPLELDHAKAGWVATNVQVFPWNHLFLDGVEIPQKEIRADDIRALVWVPEGQHTLELRTIAAPIWLWLRAMSFFVLALWLIGFATLTYRTRRAAAVSSSPIRKV